MNTNIKQNIKAIILGLILTAGISLTLADGTWTAPTCSPPECNASAPINVSGSAQIKTGKFGIGWPDSEAKRTEVDGVDAVLQVYGKFLANSGAVINGPLVIANGSQSTGRYLASDKDGKATWTEFPASLTGTAGAYTFESSYYKLMNNSDFRIWFASTPSGAALIKTEGSAKRLDEGWTENSQLMPRITADKLCNFFTDGPSIDFTVVSLGSSNNNTFYNWDNENNKWIMSGSTYIDSRDISTVTCLALNGIKRGGTLMMKDVRYGTLCGRQEYNTKPAVVCPTN